MTQFVTAHAISKCKWQLATILSILEYGVDYRTGDNSFMTFYYMLPIQWSAIAVRQDFRKTCLFLYYLYGDQEAGLQTSFMNWITNIAIGMSKLSWQFYLPSNFSNDNMDSVQPMLSQSYRVFTCKGCQSVYITPQELGKHTSICRRYKNLRNDSQPNSSGNNCSWHIGYWYPVSYRSRTDPVGLSWRYMKTVYYFHFYSKECNN